MAIDKMEEKSPEEKISERIMEHLKKVQSTEEEKLMNMQRSEFLLWRQNRIDLVKAQVMFLLMKWCLTCIPIINLRPVPQPLKITSE